MYSEGTSTAVSLRHGMDNKGVVVRFSAAEIYFSLFQGVQTVNRVHPASYALGCSGNYAR